MQSMLGTNKHRPVSVNATQINNPTQTELKLYIYLSRLNKIKLSSIKLSSIKMAVGSHYTATLWMYEFFTLH